MGLQNSAILDMDSFLGKVYYIPNYQREYSWDSNELDDFWNDLIQTKLDEAHFFGQIVIHEDSSEKKKFVIDGQQRTTTSMILLRAVMLKFVELYKATEINKARYKSEDIETKYIGREGERHLHLSEQDEEYFEKKVLSSAPQSEVKEKKKSHERLRKAFVFFADKIEEYLSENSSDDVKIDRLIALYETFKDRFKVLYMEATDLIEAFAIFETLNARGRDLATADLLKNYILKNSNAASTSLKKWNTMVNRLDRYEPTKFIRSYWNAMHEFSRERDLYRAISREVKTPYQAKELLDDLENMALPFHDLAYPKECNFFKDSELIRSLKSLDLLKAKTYFPVVLAMQVKKFQECDIREVVRTIECFVFRNFTICGRVANSAETFFAKKAQDIYNEVLTDVDGICKAILKEMASDDEFVEAFKRWSGSSSSKNAIRYIFRKIHDYLDESHELNVDNSDVHIEHIMPEDQTKWNVTEEMHEAYLWRLGNLCLLDYSFNQSMQNETIDKKLPYYKKSKIEPNRSIEGFVKTSDDGKMIWNEESIENRQGQFAELARIIWHR